MQKLTEVLEAPGKKSSRKGVMPISHTASFPEQDTIPYRLLELVAICGELPAYLLDRLPGSDSYKKAVVSSLKKDSLLRTYYRDKLRAYRISGKAKTALLSTKPERFSFYLTGNADTNILKSEVIRRIRLHRIAESYLLMQNAGVSIFRDEKPDLFAPEIDKPIRLTKPCFYSSREIKELGIEAVKIRGSRMTGTLLCGSGIYLTYNGDPTASIWDYRAEQRTRSFLELVLCHNRLVSQFGGGHVFGLLTGTGMEPLAKILSSRDSSERCFFLLDGDCPRFCYASNDHMGEILVRLLCSPNRTKMLNEVLSKGMKPKSKRLPLEHDAVDSYGNPVLYSYFMDMPRICKFCTALELQNRTGTLVCFDYQKEALQDVFGPYLKFQTISFEKFEGSIFNR